MGFISAKYPNNAPKSPAPSGTNNGRISSFILQEGYDSLLRSYMKYSNIVLMSKIINY